MTETKGQVTVRITSKQDKIGAIRNETVRIFSVSNWILALLLIPAFIALAFLGAFLFLVFFPIFIFGMVTLGFWIGWQLLKLRKSDCSESMEGEYAVIEENEIVETKDEVEKR
jgi:hypothetical protein